MTLSLIPFIIHSHLMASHSTSSHYMLQNILIKKIRTYGSCHAVDPKQRYNRPELLRVPARDRPPTTRRLAASFSPLHLIFSSRCYRTYPEIKEKRGGCLRCRKKSRKFLATFMLKDCKITVSYKDEVTCFNIKDTRLETQDGAALQTGSLLCYL
jgi:hypothetical protein